MYIRPWAKTLSIPNHLTIFFPPPPPPPLSTVVLSFCRPVYLFLFMTDDRWQVVSGVTLKDFASVSKTSLTPYPRHSQPQSWVSHTVRCTEVLYQLHTTHWIVLIVGDPTSAPHKLIGDVCAFRHSLQVPVHSMIVWCGYNYAQYTHVRGTSGCLTLSSGYQSFYIIERHTPYAIYSPAASHTRTVGNYDLALKNKTHYGLYWATESWLCDLSKASHQGNPTILCH